MKKNVQAENVDQLSGRKKYVLKKVDIDRAHQLGKVDIVRRHVMKNFKIFLDLQIMLHDILKESFRYRSYGLVLISFCCLKSKLDNVFSQNKNFFFHSRVIIFYFLFRFLVNKSIRIESTDI